MLEKLRAWTDSWTAKILLGILAATFGLSFGMSDIFQSRHPHAVVATVGKIDILTNDLRHRIEQQVGLLEQTAGRRLSPEQITQFNVPSRVLTQMIQESLLDQEVDKLNLTISDAQIGDFIQKETHFQDDKGVFSRVLFERFLHAQGLLEKAYITLLRKQLQRAQLVEALLAPLQLPPSLTTVLLSAQLQKRAGGYRLIEGKSQKISDMPTDKMLEDFYTQYTFLFKRPEKRSFTLLLIAPPGEKPAQEALYTLGKQVDDALASGETLEEVAKAHHLPLVGVDKMDRSGAAEKGGDLLPPKEGFRQHLVAHVFAGDVKTDTPVTRTPEGEQFVVRVDDIFVENTPAFQEVQTRVKEVWMQAQQNMLAQLAASDMAKEIPAQKVLAQGFIPVGPLVLSGKKKPGLPEAVYDLLFRLAPGEVRSIPAQTGAYVVQLRSLEQPTKAETARFRPDFEKEVMQTLKNDVLQAYLQSLKPLYPVKLNEAALQAVF